MTKLSYVKWIQGNKITLFCENKELLFFLKKIGARKRLFHKNVWVISYKDEKALIKNLQILNDHNFMFAGGVHEWNPLDIFILMREKKLVSGKVTEIVWKGPNQILTRSL
jgi:hypothetical protein